MPDFFQNKRVIVIGAVAGAIFLLLALMVSLFLLRKTSPVTINVWGLWEEPATFAEVVADYQRKNPSVTIKYTKQSPINYRDRLTAALASNNGPDLFVIHNTWLPMFKDSLDTMPASVFLPADFKKTFYPVASQDFVSGGKVYAIPLEIDDLALYVNQDILTAAGAVLPTTWDGTDSFVTAAQKMTVRDDRGRITTAGAAMGTASNVDHWQDIVSLMMLQAGADLNNDPASKNAQEALAYYVSFATSQKVWDETLDSSTQVFASGKLGMYFAPSWRFFDIKVLNPNLNFKVVPVPQLAGAQAANFASYWAEGVSKKSKNTKVAWDFLKVLSGKDAMTKLYSAQSKVRPFGEPYSRTDMAALLKDDPNVGVFINSAPSAKSWYLVSFVWDGDTGINSRIGKYYTDAINSMLRGTDAKTALETVAKGVKQVKTDFKINQ